MRRSERHRLNSLQTRSDYLFNHFFWPDDQMVFLDIARHTDLRIGEIRELRWNEIEIRLGKAFIREREYPLDESCLVLLARSFEKWIDLEGNPLPEGSNPRLFNHDSSKEIHKAIQQTR